MAPSPYSPRGMILLQRFASKQDERVAAAVFDEYFAAEFAQHVNAHRRGMGIQPCH